MSNDDNIIDVEIENLPAVAEQDTYQHTEQSASISRWSEQWWELQSPATQAHRCVGHKKTGQRCKNLAISGATVCRRHGGAAPQVRAAARARLENAADLMARKLLGMALSADSDSVKLAAIRDALDRAGLKPPAEVVLTPGKPKTYETVFDSIGTFTREESRMARGYPDELDIGESRGELTPDMDSTTPSTPPAPAYHPDTPCAENGFPSEDHMPPPPSRPREFDRHAHSGPPARHITGEAAMRIANQANQRTGALPAQRAIESPHKRYPRPQ